MKTFNKFEIAAIKRTAQSVGPLMSKKDRILKKIEELQGELKILDTIQEQYENSIKAMTGGFTTVDLVDRIIEPTNTVDKNGKPVKITKYVLKYPDTVLPPMEDEGEEGFTEYPVEFENI